MSDDDKKPDDSGLRDDIQSLISAIKDDRTNDPPPVKEDPPPQTPKARGFDAVNVEDLSKAIAEGKGGEAIVSTLKEVLKDYHDTAVVPRESAIITRLSVDQRKDLKRRSKEQAAKYKLEKSEFERYEADIDKFIKENNISPEQLAQDGNYDKILRMVQTEDVGFLERKMDERDNARKRNIPQVEGIGAGRDFLPHTGDISDDDINFSEDQIHMFDEMGFDTNDGSDDMKRLTEQAKKVRRVESDPKLRKQAIKDGGIPI